MIIEVKKVINELKIENHQRSEKMNTGECSDYEHTVLAHKYNNTLDIIKRLEKVVENNTWK